MSGRRSRDKGAAFERDIANQLKPQFEGARRGIGQARSASEVCDVEGTPFWIECKRHKKVSIQAAVEQAKQATDGRPVVVISKDDYGRVLVTAEMETFITWIHTLTQTSSLEELERWVKDYSATKIASS